MNQQRPKNLDLSTISFPLPALTSITHRIAGVILFVGVIFLLCVLSDSLQSAQGFAQAKQSMTTGFGSFITWGLLSALAYHFVAGIKHLVMDFGIGETKEGGKLGAIITIVLAALLIVLAGVWVWA
ncbi:succinate dehydrogenase, cytochrome b556 subunit [Bermanella marisrubri]|uniref:Succinate dehydrogenase cytochrome b556 subunit n=1 Tax=Bermanella marisrubri TaxID=207949 RepID=Q1N6I2_9GAMM|nr:succinate dehydrogenase, cytochrome b556 subunit [Bermanella marisrubri]EAT13610.1 succinate dehydrogenase, cytochrome b556 subunit [Oceanobacter sp. RED65] [Bermanella marisrubri]QIZ84398.1 succinate dehydrogenase, cytochrome b556 subunit [Bermanella marisrubri]